MSILFRLISYSLVAIAVMFSLSSTAVQAYVIQDFPGMTIENDFALAPGKTELFLNPGDIVTKELYITNRLGRDIEFVIDIEDFTGSRDPRETVVLLGDKRGPYSLRDYLKPELKNFTLKQGQRMILPVIISIPADAEPGGLYGSVLVASQPAKSTSQAEADKATGGAKIVTRLGTLFFVRVSGDVKEEGVLKKFSAKLDKYFFEKGPIPFEVLFENNGNVHLSPYGTIEVKNLLGREVEQLNIDPWFAMPDSLRAREVKWEREFLFGKYTALLKVNRGYGNIVDEMATTFWVIPWKMAVLAFAVLFLFILGMKWLFFNIEIKRKK